MPQAPQPLDGHQQELINLVKAAHQNLNLARKTKVSETGRRLAEAKLQLERDLERTEIRIRDTLDREVATHASALDEAVIAAYEAGIPVRRIALDGYGNRVDGAVHETLRALRADGRVGHRVGYQRNTTPELDTRAETTFPVPINVHEIITESTSIAGPKFENTGSLVLVEPDRDGKDGVIVPRVTLTLDSRDPWFRSIENNARVGTPFRHATSVTLYLHPATGDLVTHESREDGEVIWDHPVARWVKVHPDEARAGYLAAAQ